MTGGPGAAAGARKEHAINLFAGLPRRYDAAGAVLASARIRAGGRRWWARSAPGRRSRARRRDRNGNGRRAPVRRYGCRVVGLDQSPEMLSGAEAKLRGDRELADKIERFAARPSRCPSRTASSHLTFTYLLRYVDDPAATLAELARVVKPGGCVASLEFMLPPNAVARALWHLYARFGLPTFGRLISHDWYEVGRFLEPSISDFYRGLPLERQLELWRAAGIESVQARVMSLGGGVVIWGKRAA